MGYKFNPSMHVYVLLLIVVGIGSYFSPWGLMLLAFLLVCAKWVVLDIQKLWFWYCKWDRNRRYGKLAKAYEARLQQSDCQE